MKLLGASLATGILVTIGTLVALVFVRALFRDNVSFVIFMWLFAWPIWLLRYLPGIPYQTLAWLSLAVGALLDILIISLVTYCVLRAIVSRRKTASSSMPPPPPSFSLN